MVPGEYTAHLSRVRPEYLGHIVSFKTYDNGGSESLWRRLRECGFSTKQLDHGVRVTLHDTLTDESLHAFADVLCGLASRPLNF